MHASFAKFAVTALAVLILSLPAEANSSRVGHLPRGAVKMLIKIDAAVGSGAVAEVGRQVKINYVGWLFDPEAIAGKGEIFAKSSQTTEVTFTVGADQVIKGWDQGILGMKEGGTRRLIVPSQLAYGSAGLPNLVPPDTPLIFDVELLEVR